MLECYFFELLYVYTNAVILIIWSTYKPPDSYVCWLYRLSTFSSQCMLTKADWIWPRFWMLGVRSSFMIATWFPLNSLAEPVLCYKLLVNCFWHFRTRMIIGFIVNIIHDIKYRLYPPKWLTHNYGPIKTYLIRFRR